MPSACLATLVPVAGLAVALVAGLATPALHAQTPPGPCFGGSGGPNGDFDWVVRNGEVFLLDTTLTQIVGGPNGDPVSVQTVVDGLLDVRNLRIEAGGSVRVQGPNPLRVFATGEVVIRGRLDLSGFQARDVATLNTGNVVERGGAGGPGGGGGGDANVHVTGSSPRGGSGHGPFGQSAAGGQGGESGYAPAALGKNARRPGGGGGGRFAADRPGAPVPEGFSLVASAGTPGNEAGRGAESGLSPAQGGAPGAGAFLDEKPGNDYFGVRPVLGGGNVLTLMRGELPSLWAGYGGGGGGNAIPSETFPNPNFNLATDEKGGAGGGGGGALHVKAIGRIAFGAQGEILCNGGLGGAGENTNFLDHVGGTGGAGSGGHVVLETAAHIDFTDGGQNVGAAPRTWILAAGKPLKTGRLVDVEVCCRANSNGGASSGGVVQLHVPRASLPPGTDPARTDILVPDAVAELRDPLLALGAPRAYALFPTCASFLRASAAGRGGWGAGWGAGPSSGQAATGVPRSLWPAALPPATGIEPGALELPPRP